MTKTARYGEAATAEMLRKLRASEAPVSRYQCISLPNSSEHHIEDKIPHRRANMWIVPGTYPDDPACAQAGAMAHYARSHRTNYWLRDYP